MKKLNFLSVLVLSTCFLIAGCSSPKDKKVGETGKDAIVWAGWAGEEDATREMVKEMIDSFNSQNETEVSWVGWPWAETQQQLVIRSQGSEVLDVAQVDINMFGALSEMGILVDINELIGEDFLRENFEASSLDIGNVDGKQLAMPWSIASIGMLYNPEILAAVGYDKPPVTVEDFEKCMAKIKAYDPTIIPYGVATKEGTMATDFQPWLWTFGGEIIAEDGSIAIEDHEAIKAVEWYKSLLSNDYIQMNITRFDARQMFAEGKIAFYDDAISARGIGVENGIAESELTEKMQPMNRPVLSEGDEPQSSMWGHMLVVFDKSKNKKAAGNFVKHLVSEEMALKYLETSGMPPVLKTAIDSDEVKNDKWVSQWLEMTTTGRTLEFALNSNGSELNNILVEELQAILVSDKRVKEGLKDAATRLEEAQN